MNIQFIKFSAWVAKLVAPSAINLKGSSPGLGNFMFWNIFFCFLFQKQVPKTKRQINENFSIFFPQKWMLEMCQRFRNLKFIENKPECVYGSTVCKCPISSQTIKYRYKFKSNPNFFFLKNTCMDPLKVCTKFGVCSTSLS